MNLEKPIATMIALIIGFFVLVILIMVVEKIHAGICEMQKQENERKIRRFITSRWCTPQ